MKARDLITNHNFNEVERMWNQGRLSDREWHRYRFAWTWCAARWSNVCRAGEKQERFWNRFGKEAYYRRMNRVRRICGFAPITP